MACYGPIPQGYFLTALGISLRIKVKLSFFLCLTRGLSSMINGRRFISPLHAEKDGKLEEKKNREKVENVSPTGLH